MSLAGRDIAGGLSLAVTPRHVQPRGTAGWRSWGAARTSPWTRAQAEPRTHRSRKREEDGEYLNIERGRDLVQQPGSFQMS